MSDPSQILARLEAGDRAASRELFPQVYDELRRLAAGKMAGENPGQTLQATALVHEAFLRLIGDANSAGWQTRGHFFAAAGEAMRRILIENARRRRRVKRGGDRARISLSEIAAGSQEADDELLAVDEALEHLAAESPPLAKLVELKYFAGLTHEELAECLGISIATSKRHWRYARAWLRRKIAVDHGESPPE